MSTRHQITYTLHPFGETTQFSTNVAWFTTTTSFCPVLYASSFGMKRSNKYKNTAKGEGKDFIQNFRENETKMLTLSWKFVNSAYSVSVTCHNLCLSSGIELLQLHVIWVVERPYDRHTVTSPPIGHQYSRLRQIVTLKNIAEICAYLLKILPGSIEDSVFKGLDLPKLIYIDLCVPNPKKWPWVCIRPLTLYKELLTELTSLV